MKNINTNYIFLLVILAVGVLAYISYHTGYKQSKNDMGSLLMTMNIDSNLVTTGIYEELPNNVRKTMHFFIEDTPTIVNDVKLYAEIKYATIGNEVINVEDGKFWNIIKRDRIFQRQFNESDESESNITPNSSLAAKKISKKNKSIL